MVPAGNDIWINKFILLTLNTIRLIVGFQMSHSEGCHLSQISSTSLDSASSSLQSQLSRALRAMVGFSLAIFRYSNGKYEHASVLKDIKRGLSISKY